MVDSLASIFLLLAVLVGVPLTVIAIVLITKVKGTGRYVVLFFAVLTVLLMIGTIVNAIIGNSNAKIYGDYVRHHPCTWVALGLSCGTMGVGLINTIIALFLFAANKNAPKKAAQTSNSGDTYETGDDESEYVVVKKKIDGDVVLFTASSNNGVGLWTSICISFASIFGVESKNYTKKLNMTMNRVKNKLTQLMEQYPEFEYRDFRIVKEGNIAYTGSVMGIKKK